MSFSFKLWTYRALNVELLFSASHFTCWNISFCGIGLVTKTTHLFFFVVACSTARQPYLIMQVSTCMCAVRSDLQSKHLFWSTSWLFKTKLTISYMPTLKDLMFWTQKFYRSYGIKMEIHSSGQGVSDPEFMQVRLYVLAVADHNIASTLTFPKTEECSAVK